MKYNKICKSFNCKYYTEWEFYRKTLYSCKLQGESDNILAIAKNCPYKNNIKISEHEKDN